MKKWILFFLALSLLLPLPLLAEEDDLLIHRGDRIGHDLIRHVAAWDLVIKDLSGPWLMTATDQFLQGGLSAA